MPARADPDLPADPGMGERLRAIRERAGSDQMRFAQGLDLSPDAYAAIERGESPLPAVCLPRLAALADAPLTRVLAELHAAPETAAELHTLVTAFNAIPTRMGREALLTLALSYSASPG